MVVPTLQSELWFEIMAWGGPLSLCLFPLKLNCKELAAIRIQRFVRRTLTPLHFFTPGSVVRASIRGCPWMDGVVISAERNLTTIQILRPGIKSKQYFFLPHPNVRYRMKKSCHIVKKNVGKTFFSICSTD
jgi:hypothetical protein